MNFEIVFLTIATIFVLATKPVEAQEFPGPNDGDTVQVRNDQQAGSIDASRYKDGALLSVHHANESGLTGSEGLTGADIVMSGGGTGPGSQPYSFNLDNVNED